MRFDYTTYTKLNTLMETTEPERRAAELTRCFPYVCARSRRYQQRWASAYLIRGHDPADATNYPELRETLITISSAIDDRVVFLDQTIGVPRKFLRLWQRKQGFRMLVARRWLVEGVGCIDTLIKTGAIPPAPRVKAAPAWEADFCKHFGLKTAPRSYLNEALGSMTATTRGQLAVALLEAQALLGVR
jgi:hypothetical protein